MINLTINLNARLQPMHRHDLEDALTTVLDDLGIEAEVTGGGTALGQNNEASSCDIELQLADASDDHITKIITKIIGIMESMLAPVGSKIIIYPQDGDDNENDEVERIAFGVHEGLALYLNGEDLEDEVYQNCDVNYVYQEAERLLKETNKGHIASYWEGEETAFYLYGKSFVEMHNCIKPLLDEYPLCAQCRIEKIA